MMSVICAVCRNSLVSSDESEATEDKRICATKCHHVFHGKCLDLWWGTIANVAAENLQPPQYACPCCGVSVPRGIVFEVMLTTGQEDSDLVANEADLAATERDLLTTERDELRAKVQQLQDEKKELAAALEEAKKELARVTRINPTDATQPKEKHKSDKKE